MSSTADQKGTEEGEQGDEGISDARHEGGGDDSDKTWNMVELETMAWLVLRVRGDDDNGDGTNGDDGGHDDGDGRVSADQ